MHPPRTWQPYSRPGHISASARGRKKLGSESSSEGSSSGSSFEPTSCDTQNKLTVMTRAEKTHKPKGIYKQRIYILKTTKQHYFIRCLLLVSPRTAKNHQEQPRTAKNCQEHAKNQLINDCTHAPFSDTPDPTHQPSHRSQGSKIRGRRCPGLWPASIPPPPALAGVHGVLDSRRKFLPNSA